MQQGRYAEAETHFDELLRVRRRILPATHAHLLTTMDYLALVYGFLGQYAKAETLCAEAVKAIATIEGLDTERALVYRSNLAEYLRNQGKYADAEKLFREVRAAQDRALAADHLNRFETLNSLSVQYYLQGRFAEAEGLARECLRGRRDLARLGPDDYRVGDALSLCCSVVRSDASEAKRALHGGMQRASEEVRVVQAGKTDWAKKQNSLNRDGRMS